MKTRSKETGGNVNNMIILMTKEMKNKNGRLMQMKVVVVVVVMMMMMIMVEKVKI